MNQYNLSVLYNLNERINYIKYYIFLYVVIFILLLILFVPYNVNYHYKLYINNNYTLIVDDNYFPLKKTYLYIENKKYSYNVLNVSKHFVDNKIYYEVLIDINLKDYNKKNIIDVTILKEKTTIFRNLINKMKGW